MRPEPYTASSSHDRASCGTADAPSPAPSFTHAWQNSRRLAQEAPRTRAKMGRTRQPCRCRFGKAYDTSNTAHRRCPSRSTGGHRAHHVEENRARTGAGQRASAGVGNRARLDVFVRPRPAQHSSQHVMHWHRKLRALVTAGSTRYKSRSASARRLMASASSAAGNTALARQRRVRGIVDASDRRLA